MGAHPLYGALSQRWLLDPIKPAYNRSRPDGRLKLLASALLKNSNEMSQPYGRRNIHIITEYVNEQNAFVNNI